MRKVGIHSIPRPVTKGFYNEWLNAPRINTTAIGFPLPRTADDDSDAWDDWIRLSPSTKPPAKSNP